MPDGDGSGHATCEQAEPGYQPMAKNEDRERSIRGMVESVLTAEREREREREADRAWTSGQDGKCTTCGSGACGQKQSDTSNRRTGSCRTENEQARQGTPVVVDDECGGELSVLDKQLLTGGAPHTHTGRRCSIGGSGCSENQRTETNQTQSSGSAIPDLLAVEMPGETVGRGTKAFNPDPHIADYESGESLFLAWVGGVPYPGSTETKILRK